MIDSNRLELLQRIINKIDRDRLTLDVLDHQQVVITATVGPLDPELRIGYCTQIRKRPGRTPQVLLRHADGHLRTHDDEMFYTLTPEQEALAHELFAELKASEDSSQGYRCTAGIHHVGFLVDKSA